MANEKYIEGTENGENGGDRITFSADIFTPEEMEELTSIAEAVSVAEERQKNRRELEEARILEIEKLRIEISNANTKMEVLRLDESEEGVAKVEALKEVLDMLEGELVATEAMSPYELYILNLKAGEVANKETEEDVA